MQAEWSEDLKKVLLMAGESNQKTVFLFTDTQIKLESFVEDISNLLNTYEVCCRCDAPHVRPRCLAECVITAAMCSSILAQQLPPHLLLVVTSWNSAPGCRFQICCSQQTLPLPLRTCGPWQSKLGWTAIGTACMPSSYSR